MNYLCRRKQRIAYIGKVSVYRLRIEKLYVNITVCNGRNRIVLLCGICVALRSKLYRKGRAPCDIECKRRVLCTRLTRSERDCIILGKLALINLGYGNAFGVGRILFGNIYALSATQIIIAVAAFGLIHNTAHLVVNSALRQIAVCGARPVIGGIAVKGFRLTCYNFNHLCAVERLVAQAYNRR